MLDYDFSILQYNEFECLTRDLLQVEFGIYIESFKDGRDNGIDFRFGAVKGRTTIVQVKRYKTWNELKLKLSEEAAKVKKLNPGRYLLVTSVGLSPANKDEIVNVFTPYIKSTVDVFGKDDLNNLLGKHPDVEKKFYKLWLASTNILQEIVNKSVVNWSSFELDSIREQISLYVENQSFNRASEILEKNRYVIISGIPGIGKTTLARYLVYSILANGYEEFVYIENNLDDAAKLFQKGKKQIFFYDDFLGSNFFDPLEKNFDKKLVDFINAIKREKDKLFILTTREYVLSDALNYYEKLKNNVEIAKCTLDLGQYTKYIRAKILYNHLERAELPITYIDNLLKDKRYKKLIEHKNYNPRVIEAFIDNEQFIDVSSDNFFAKFKEYFDNPFMVWDSAFGKLDVKGRIALQILYSMGKVVYLEDWHDAFIKFCQNTMPKRGITCDEVEWINCLRILENCFVKIDINDSNHVVSFFNPSIIDFIGTQLKKDIGLQEDIIGSAIFVNQIYTVFRDSPMYATYGMMPINVVSESLYPAVIENFKRLYNHYKSCSLVLKSGNKYIYENESDVLIACRFIDSFPNLTSEYTDVVESVLKVESLTDENISFSDRVQLIRKLKWDCIGTDRNTIIDCLIEEDRNLDEHVDLLSLLDFLNLTEEKCDDELYDNIFTDFVYAIENDVSTLEEAETIEQMVDDIEKFMPHKEDIDTIRETLKEKKSEIEVPDYGDYDDYDPYWRREIDDTSLEEDKKIDEMMTCLRVR